MSPMRAGAKVIGDFVDALKAQPVVLALVVMDLAMISLLFYVAMARHTELNMFLVVQKDLAALLAKCGAAQ